MPETAKLTGIGLQKLKQIAREYADFPYIKTGLRSTREKSYEETSDCNS